MSITHEQAEAIKLKDELAPLRRLKEAKLGGRDLELERKRLFDEELTEIAEAIDSHYLQSAFVYGFDGSRAILPDGTALAQMYQNGVDTAEQMARRWPAYGFELERRRAEAANQGLIDAMLAGRHPANTIVELSPYPDEAELSCEPSLLEAAGYKSELKRGMVRIVRRLDDGQMSLTTFSLDNSSLNLFQSLQTELGLAAGATTTDILARPAMLNTEETPQQMAERLINCYDAQLAAQTGEAHHRGRRFGHGNSLDLLENSSEVLNFYFNQLDILSGDWAEETISPALADTIGTIMATGNVPGRLRAELGGALRTGRLNEAGASVVKRALELSVWATIVARLDDPELAAAGVNFSQMLDNARQAEAAGQRMVGCGGATSLFTASRSGAMEQVFGNWLRLESRYSFNRRMHCVVCQKPPKRDPKTKKVEYQKWCGPCGICKGCDGKLKKKTI